MSKSGQQLEQQRGDPDTFSPAGSTNLTDGWGSGTAIPFRAIALSAATGSLGHAYLACSNTTMVKSMEILENKQERDNGTEKWKLEEKRYR